MNGSDGCAWCSWFLTPPPSEIVGALDRPRRTVLPFSVMTTLARMKRLLILLALPLVFIAGYGVGYRARATKYKKWYVHVQDVHAALRDLDDFRAHPGSSAFLWDR